MVFSLYVSNNGCFSAARRPKKIGKKTLELLRKQNEELSKKEAEKEPESKRMQETKPEKVEKPSKIDQHEKVKEVKLPLRDFINHILSHFFATAMAAGIETDGVKNYRSRLSLNIELDFTY